MSEKVSNHNKQTNTFIELIVFKYFMILKSNIYFEIFQNKNKLNNVVGAFCLADVPS